MSQPTNQRPVLNDKFLAKSERTKACFWSLTPPLFWWSNTNGISYISPTYETGFNWQMREKQGLTRKGKLGARNTFREWPTEYSF